jgi:hypothetical protein
MFSLNTVFGHSTSSASFGLDQRIGTGPFSFLFDPSLLTTWASQASIVYCGLVLAVMATALLASKAEKRMLKTA